jgi:hypothetical protein
MNRRNLLHSYAGRNLTRLGSILTYLFLCTGTYAQGTNTYFFTYTGSAAIVPLPNPLPSDNVSLSIAALGGEGGSSPDFNQDTFVQTGISPGGFGAVVRVVYNLTLNSKTSYSLLVNVGGGGGTPKYAYPSGQNTLLCNNSSNLGGFPGSGNGGRGSTYGGCGAGGGGESRVFLLGNLNGSGETTLVYAGGGGGAGGAAATPEDFIVGSQGAGGNAGSTPQPGAPGGEGPDGTQAPGGCAGCESLIVDTNGGSSSLLNLFGGGGGGGGGGYGGGGGGSASSDWGGGGGGAGASYVNTSLDIVGSSITTADSLSYQSGPNGAIVITATFLASASPIPEPSSFVLLGCGAVLLAAWSRFGSYRGLAGRSLRF